MNKVKKQNKRKTGDYPNALTRKHVQSSHQFAFFTLEWNGEQKEVYYRSLSTATMVRIADPEFRKRPDLLDYAIGIITEHVVDISTGEPLMSKEEWMQEDSDLVILVIQEVVGLMFGADSGDGVGGSDTETEEKNITPAELSGDSEDPN